jgi:hypothetical protein
MAGDQRAAAWCARHAPPADYQSLWRAYDTLRGNAARVGRAYERLHLLWRGTDKLRTGRWQEGSAECIAWSEELREAFTSPEAKADIESCALNVESWTLEHREDFFEAVSDLYTLLAKRHGLDVGKLQTQAQADRFVASVGTDAFESTCRDLADEVGLIAGKEQAEGVSNGNSDKHQLA